MDKYTEFRMDVLIKTLIIYIFTFLMYFFPRLIMKKQSFNLSINNDLKKL